MNTEVKSYPQYTAEQLHKFQVTKQLKQQIKEMSQYSREVKRERKSTLPDSERKHFLATEANLSNWATPHYRAQLRSRRIKVELRDLHLVYAYLRGKDLDATDRNWRDVHSIDSIKNQAESFLSKK